MKISDQIKEAYEKQADNIESRINKELRDARKSQTSLDKIQHEVRAQVLRKKLRALNIEYHKLEDAE